MAADKGTQVVVDGRSIKVTNLDKVMYPAAGVTKGDVIGYYQAVARWMIPHTARRPATRKRWPNGVGTPSHPQRPFFHKNLDPKSTPDWVRTFTIEHSDGPSTYPLVDDAATLVWLAQLASLELHVPQWTVGPDGTPRHPNRLVLDLDPGEGAGMPQCVELAHHIRGVLDGVGFPSFPVTSGSKGIHLYAALDGSMTSEDASDFARELARSLESLHPELVVSDMKKTVREGKVLLDWSQNNAAKTTVAPYSLRGRDHPTVATPRTWDEITPDLGQLEFHEVLERLASLGDPLAALDAAGAATASGSDRLSTYRSMRDAKKTPEPVPAAPPVPRPEGNSFVIQEHHARRLHHDFRLERDGVLVSWALPKGPPTDPKTNHLAVQTEDHPLDYGTFEGDIPRGEYGAGHVTIWDAGTYEAEKWIDGREVIATLTGRPDGGLGGAPRRFALIRTGRDEKNWLIHLMNPPDPRSGLPVIEPMLATPGERRDVAGQGWRFEVKWDGYRAVASVAGGRATFRSRGGLDLTASYPELGELGSLLREHEAVLDGEVVVLDERGRPRFELLQNHQRSPGSAHYMVFDLLYLDGRSLVRTPYLERREALLSLLGEGGRHVHAPDDLGSDADVALAASAEQGLEGVVGKKEDSVYQPGRRGRTWIKVKIIQSQDVVVVGWAPGENARARTIGALLVAVPEGGDLVYVGRVGSGFTEEALRQARSVLADIETSDPPVAGVGRQEARGVHWVEPLLVGEVTYSEYTGVGRLRHPVWKGWRPDRRPEDVTWERRGV
ncbi:MAG: ATP-dependent DNA ligase [Actinomycetes bacterium]